MMQTGSGRRGSARSKEMPNASPTVLISGYYGCGNIGDEAVLGGMLHALKQIRSDSEVQYIVLSQNPPETANMHHVPSLHRMRFGDVYHMINRCNLLISGGGSLLQDTTSLHSLVYYLFVIYLAIKCKKPAVIYAQGIGPIRRPLARYVTQWVLNKTRFITVRDEESRRLLKTIKVSIPPITVTSDPAFLLEPADTGKVGAILLENRVPKDKKLMGFALRPWKYPSLEHLTAMVEEISKLTEYHPVFLPMHSGSDIFFSSMIREKLNCPSSIIRSKMNYEEALGVISSFTAIAAMRLHALIFGASTGSKLFSLSYDPKVESLMKSLDLDAYCEDVQGFDPVNAAKKVAKMIEDPNAGRVTQEKMALIRESAIENAKIALAILDEK